VTRLWVGPSGVRFPAEVRLSSSPKRPDRLWGPPRILLYGYHGFFLLPRLRMSREISLRPLHAFVACTGNLPNGNDVKSLSNMLRSSTGIQNPTVDEGEWSAPRSGCLSPREMVPGNNWMAQWLDPTTYLDVGAKVKVLTSTEESILRNQTLYWLSYKEISA
jgi:hypothetical protein